MIFFLLRVSIFIIRMSFKIWIFFIIITFILIISWNILVEGIEILKVKVSLIHRLHWITLLILWGSCIWLVWVSLSEGQSIWMLLVLRICGLGYICLLLHMPSVRRLRQKVWFMFIDLLWCSCWTFSFTHAESTCKLSWIILIFCRNYKFWGAFFINSTFSSYHLRLNVMALYYFAFKTIITSRLYFKSCSSITCHSAWIALHGGESTEIHHGHSFHLLNALKFSLQSTKALTKMAAYLYLLSAFRFSWTFSSHSLWSNKVYSLIWFLLIINRG